MSAFFKHVRYVLPLFVAFFSTSLFAAGDTLSLSPKSAAIVASIDDMSEPELVLLIDSLFDSNTKDPKLFAIIKSRIEELKSEQQKNQFDNGFDFYPGDRFYGVWDTKHVFPYSDSLYKCDTITNIDLSVATSGEFTFPVIGPITSPFGWRDTAYHRGIDIDLNKGDTVRCAFGGMVRFAGMQGGFGNVIIVRHYNGLETVYGHLSRIKVHAGDLVTTGQLIGLGGSTGHSTGSHLHFEVRFRGVAIDPTFFIDLKTHQLIADHVLLVRTREGYGVRYEGVEFHTVVRGDSYAKIAQHYGISIKQLKEYNEWDGYVRLKAGMKVRVQPAEIPSSTF